MSMPTYEYKCGKCRRRLERFQNMSDEPLRICPHCGGELRRIVNTGSGIIFKGTGFYATDYKNNGPKCRRNGSK